MKPSRPGKKAKHNPAAPKPQLKPPANQQASTQAAPPSRWRWPVIALVVLLTAGGTWAAFEFFIFSSLPPELVGKWVIEGGPQDGATFDFSRNGTVEAHFNGNGMEHVLKGKAAVDQKQLLITTENPHTKQDETRTCVIRELTERTLVVEFPGGEVFKMTRAL
jgi:hypothetical protein